MTDRTPGGDAASVHNPAMASRRALIGMVGLMGTSGVLHFVIPGPYRSIVPAPVERYRVELVALSGVAEIACAGLLAMPRTRVLGAWATAALLVAVFPANVQMALDGGARDASGLLASRAVAWARLPLQLPLVIWAFRLRRDAAKPAS